MPAGDRTYPRRVQSSDKKITVVVVDDHPFFRDGVSRGLTNSGLITVVGEAGTGREALAVIAAERPDVALVDYQLPDLDGLDVVHAIVRDKLPTRLLLLSAITAQARPPTLGGSRIRVPTTNSASTPRRTSCRVMPRCA